MPSKVGSILSINSLRENLKVSFETVESWINILEKLYGCLESILHQVLNIFLKKTDIPIFYQVHLDLKYYENLDYSTRVMPFNKFALEIQV